MKVSLIIFVFLSLSVSSSMAQQKDLAVVAYYTGDASDIQNFRVDELTHIIYSFGHLQGNKLQVDNEKSEAAIRRLVKLKDTYPELKVMLSLGGWGGCPTCSRVFSTPEGRVEFAHSVKVLEQRLGIDGLDLDWEYPSIEGYPGHKFSPEDKPNFTTVVKTLRDSMPASIITFAAGGFQKYLDSAVEWKEVMKYVDFVNLMTYDLVNGYSKLTGHHTPLYSNHAGMESTDHAVQYLSRLGVPKNKMVIGAAFYGRVWKDVAPAHHGLYQAGTFKESIPYRKMNAIFSKSGGFKKFWDKGAQAPYGYNKKLHEFITFDNKKSLILKTRYAKSQGLRGIMFWQITLDKQENGLLQAIYDAKMKP